MRLLHLLQLHGRAPTTAEVRLLSERGLMDPIEARAIIEHLCRDSFFASPLPSARRMLLAALSRAGRARPRLIVDNTSSRPTMPARVLGEPQPPSVA
jgi:hypothetical protein